MKKYIIVLVSLSIFFSCNQAEEANKKEVSGIKMKVDSLLTKWHKDAAETNFEDYFGLMDSTSIFIGTDASEYWTKEQFADFCKPYFDKGEAWDFKAIERNIYVSDAVDIVWFDELLNTWMGTCRGSGTLKNTHRGWKLQHYVLSIEIPNEVVREVIKVKAESDSIFLSKF